MRYTFCTYMQPGGEAKEKRHISFRGENKGKQRMFDRKKVHRNSFMKNRRKTTSRRAVLLLFLIVCLVLEGGVPALAKKKAESSSKVQIIYTPAKTKGWHGGTWENGCYINDSGIVMERLESADKAKIPKLRGLGGKKILFIGASRTKRVSKAVTDSSVFFYGCGGAGFRWFFHPRNGKKPAYQVIRAFIKAHPHGTIIIDLGGNDVHNIEAYIGFYKQLIEKYPDVTFFFRGILPREIGDKSNARRLAFNEKLEEALPGHVINLFEKVYHMRGFKTVDGTHYPKRQNRKIYQMTMEKIGRKISVNLDTGKVTSKKTKKKK